jgi:hypothetical protein
MLGWVRCRFHKKRIERRFAELAFLHPIGSMGHIVLSGASGHETSTHYFSCLGGTGTNRQKQTVTRYAEQVFLHPVGFACHIVHCGVSGPRNIDALFFMLG